MKTERDALAERLQEYRWVHPEYYAGFSPSRSYVVAQMHRDSDALQRANYRVIRDRLIDAYRAALGAAADPGLCADEEADLIEWEARHWAVGWVRTLAVNFDAPTEVLDEMAGILDELEAYPILDEELYSEMEADEVQETWAIGSIADRIAWLADAGCSIFAARRDEFPWDADGGGALYDALRS